MVSLQPRQQPALPARKKLPLPVPGAGNRPAAAFRYHHAFGRAKKGNGQMAVFRLEHAFSRPNEVRFPASFPFKQAFNRRKNVILIPPEQVIWGKKVWVRLKGLLQNGNAMAICTKNEKQTIKTGPQKSGSASFGDRFLCILFGQGHFAAVPCQGGEFPPQRKLAALPGGVNRLPMPAGRKNDCRFAPRETLFWYAMPVFGLWGR